MDGSGWECEWFGVLCGGCELGPKGTQRKGKELK